jgi:FkbM family methyltransferase
MNRFKRCFKRNSHNLFFKPLAGFGRSLNRLYENRNHDPYSNGEVTVIRKMAALNPAVIIDGGANIGEYSLMLRRFCPETLIYAFEPVGDTFTKLKARVAPHANIIPVNKGLFSEHCTKEIHLFESHTHSSLYDIKGIAQQSRRTQQIELTTGDLFARENNLEAIDFVKLDLEGAEYDAIMGFEALLRQKKIKAVQFEYGYINITTHKLLVDYYTLFKDYHYQVGKVFPKIVEFRNYHFKHEDFIGPNFLAVLSDEEGLIRSLSQR